MIEIASTPYTTCGGGYTGGCGGAYSSFRGYSCGGGSSCG